MTKFTPPVVVRGSRIAEMVEANSLRFLRVQNVELQVGMRGRSEGEDSSLRRVHAGIISSTRFWICPSPRGTFWYKVFEGKGLSLDFPSSGLRLKAKARLLAGPFFLFSISLNCSGLSETKMPIWVDLFFACRWLISSYLWIFG